MSPEDLTSYDDDGKKVFTMLPSLQKTMHHDYYPSVENPVETLQSLKLDTKDDIIIVPIGDASNEETRNEMLKSHDNMVYAAIQQIVKQNNEVVAIYTGKRSSWQDPSDEQEVRVRRQLLATKADDNIEGNITSNFINDTNLFIYSTNNLTIEYDNLTHFINSCENSVKNEETITYKMCSDDDVSVL